MKQKGILIALAIAVFVTLLFTGCPWMYTDVTGSWSGPLEIEGAPYEYTLSAELSQSDSAVTGTADISYGGEVLTEYDVVATITGYDIDGIMYGIDSIDEETYDIEFTAIVNSAYNEMNGNFDIQVSEASGTFTMTR